ESWASTYNPTQWQLKEAARHDRHAASHERAAAKLETFADQECAGFSVAVRAACPTFSPIEKLEEIDGGVRLYFRSDVDAGAVAAHMRCHLAYARMYGFEGIPDCPLYIKGVDIRRSSDGRAIEIVGNK